MESESIIVKSGFKQFIVIITLTLIASMLPEILFRELTGTIPVGLSLARLILLSIAGTLSQIKKRKNITKYTIVLVVIVLAEFITGLVFSAPIWQKTFDMHSFVGNFGGSIALKLIGIIPVIGILIALFKSPKAVYISTGDWFTKADEIKWLGIKNEIGRAHV